MKTKTRTKTILTSASGTGSVDLPIPVSRVVEAKIVKGVGELRVEALANSGCRLFVSGGVLDGEVAVEYELTEG